MRDDDDYADGSAFPKEGTAAEGAGPHDEVLAQVARRYAVEITPAMTALMVPGDERDPIRLQFAPDLRELDASASECVDPIGDGHHEVAPGLIHRYRDRVLFKVVSVCAVYCRFCFRREMVGPGRARRLAPEDFDRALTYIKAHEDIWEVILSGGDPLILSPRRVREISLALAAIGHVKVVRWHTRVPVVAPERINAKLVDALKCEGKAVFVALHANHPRELTTSARQASGRLIDAGIPMVSQTVLLKGVNDDAETLERLMRAFVETRIKPYYLHHLDHAPGTGHFRTSLSRGQELARQLRQRASGLCQPLYVLDIPGGAGKVPVGPAYLDQPVPSEGGCRTVRDPHGRVHNYEDKG